MRAQRPLLGSVRVQREPLGTLALDLGGRITFVNSAAAGLLGRPAEQLLGTQPWQSLPWLDSITFMDAYRTAFSSREPLALTVLRPPDQWLDLRLHTDDRGTSVLITPDRSPKPLAARPASTGTPPESRIHLLMTLAAALTETVGVQDVVDLIADQILPAFGAHGMIMSTADSGRIQIIGYRGYTPAVIEQLDGLPMDADLTPAGHALATGAFSFFADHGELTRLCPRSPQISDKQAWAFLPLITSGRTLGCLLLAYNHPHRFTTAERSVLTPLAGLIAQALDRARLYDAKHSLAHALQQALLPHALPGVTGLGVAARYLPASHGMDIGGDFYDLIRLTDTTAAAVIGDVQGHDMTAAALMGQIRMAVHSHTTAGAAPDQVLSRTDRDLADLNAGRFVTCLYAHLDLARHQVTFAGAGHPPPLLRRPGDRAHALDIRPGPPLGLGLGTPPSRSPRRLSPRRPCSPSTPTVSWKSPAPTSPRPPRTSPTTSASRSTFPCTGWRTASSSAHATPTATGIVTTSLCSCSNRPRARTEATVNTMIDHAHDLVSVREATGRLLAAAAHLAGASVAAPSRLPGWSRGHVLAHLARNADALVNALEGRPMYASATARDADIERDAPRPLDVQLTDVRDSAARFEQAGAAPADWSRTVELRNGVTDAAARLPFRRWAEVELHHVDLGIGYELEDLPAEFVEREIHFLTQRFTGHPDVPPTRLTDGTRAWSTGRGAGAPEVTVRGPAPDLLGWLAGRRDGTGLTAEGGTLPTPPPL